MTLHVDATEDDVFTALRSFLLSFLSGVEVFKAQANRVPEPSVLNFITMTPMGRVRLETNVSDYDPLINQRIITQPTQFSVQLDVHGPESGDNSQLISTLFRDGYGTTQFEANGFEIQPLYINDPKQIPFINAEDQYEDRWVIGIELQFNPKVVADQLFAKAIDINVINVDATYPP